MSVEAWIKPNNITDAQPLVEWNSNTGGFNGIGAHFWIAVAASGGGPGSLWVNLLDSSLTPHQFSTTTGLVVPNVYQHVAFTYDKASGLLVIYLNGTNVGHTTLGSSFIANTTSDVYLGLRPPGGGGPTYFNGALDEVSIYNRALSSFEIQSIYNAGAAGKCQGTNPPAIISQPADVAAIVGSIAVFTVGVSGSTPLTYQWEFNGTNLTGATSAALTISNVQSSNVGVYSAMVSNLYGSVTSSNASLTILTPPSIITQPQDQTVMQGAPVTLSVTASGDSPLSYQWRVGGTLLVGATNSSLNIAAAQATDAGNYRVLVSNPVGSILSSNAVLTVNSGPVIIAQPVDSTVTAGNNAVFSVNVVGSLPLVYQWQFNGTNLSGGTASSFTVANAQAANAGTYSVTITNGFGSVTSSNADLAVNPLNCFPAPSGMVGWWPLDGNWIDLINGDTGIASGGTNFATGKVAQAMVFNGSNRSVRIPASTNLDVGSGGGMSIETWIKPASVSSAQPLVEWNSNAGGSAGIGAQFWIAVGASGGGSGSLWANLIESNLTPHQLSSTTGLVVANVYQHVALTYDKSSGMAVIYLNGVSVAQANLGTNFVPSTKSDVYLGLRPPGGFGPVYYNGAMDEVSIYSRALTATEVQGIYNAGSAGKCQAPNPPSIFAQPASQSVVPGGNALLVVGAAGSTPLSYQWEFNGMNITGATDSTLALVNVQPGAAGAYAVTVTNAVGSVTSSNAVLTVTLPPSMVQIVSVTATSGIVTVPIDLIAQGNENAVGFSVNYNPALLSFIGVNLGSGAAGGSLLDNANLVNSGKLGIAISMPVNSTFAAGTQEVANISFFVTAVTNQRTASITFGDQPILRQIVDPQANILSATYINGAVTIPSVTNANLGIEGDVTPGPGGDGKVTIADWVQEGRYVAGLDIITNASVYQHADCAPRATLGDGQLTIADWVQVGRYALGLDPITPAGGPSTGNGVSAPSGYSPLDLGPRKLTVVPPAGVVAGQTVKVSIQLNAQGNENAAGFSLNFDPTVLSYSGASLGSNAAGAQLNVNSYQAASGKLGAALALNTGTAFAAGTQEVLQVTFVVSPLAVSPASIKFGSLPIVSETADPSAKTLSTTYVNGTLSITPLNTPPTLQLAIAPDKSNLVLSWPTTAAGFNLESSLDLTPGSWNSLNSTLVTNANSISATVPISGAQQFFRLHHP